MRVVCLSLGCVSGVVHMDLCRSERVRTSVSYFRCFGCAYGAYVGAYLRVCVLCFRSRGGYYRVIIGISAYEKSDVSGMRFPRLSDRPLAADATGLVGVSRGLAGSLTPLM